MLTTLGRSLREYEIQTGVKVDALLVDYLDLMMPISGKVSSKRLVY